MADSFKKAYTKYQKEKEERAKSKKTDKPRRKAPMKIIDYGEDAILYRHNARY